MTRAPLIEKDQTAGRDREIFEAIEASRGVPPGGIWRALMNAPSIAQKVLGLADELRHGVEIDKRHRELAALMVGYCTKCQYEIDHHWKAALKAGIHREQLEALPEFETTDLFDAQERAVLRFAREITLSGKVTAKTWADLGSFHSDKTMIELLMTIAWYNAVVRIIMPLELENEPGFKRE